MLTTHPNIIYVLPPKRKKVRVEHPNLPTVVHALSPKEIERKQRAAALAAKIACMVDATKPSPLDEIDREKASFDPSAGHP
jgi:hypothetical protein